MNKQVNNGRAFEWAVSMALHLETALSIEGTEQTYAAKKSYDSLNECKRNAFFNTAQIAVQHILNKEKFGGCTGRIALNSARSGESGDVRDLIIHLDNQKTLGLSCKHNHSALKHSRLSDKIDFINKWGIDEAGCSSSYWNAVQPLFSQLKKIKEATFGSTLWTHLNDKAEKYYWPILEAWANELKRIKNKGKDSEQRLCENLLRYIIGKHDFYKIIKRGDSEVNLQCWNFNGTLVPAKTKFPISIVSFHNKNGGQYSKTITFNGGYSLNFRIHNASSRVEPSLKFDINALGLPPEQIYQQTLNATEKKTSSHVSSVKNVEMFLQ